MAIYEILFGVFGLHLLMAGIMALFPRDEGMRSRTGIASYTPEPQTAGDRFFNGLVWIMAGGGLLMERLNERIARKPWYVRIAIRVTTLAAAAVLALFLIILVGALE